MAIETGVKVLAHFPAIVPGLVRHYGNYSRGRMGGVASLRKPIPSDFPFAGVNGSVALVSDEDLSKLDIREGHPFKYLRQKVKAHVFFKCLSNKTQDIIRPSGAKNTHEIAHLPDAEKPHEISHQTLEVWTYMLLESGKSWVAPPSKEYLNLCLQNLDQFWDIDGIVVRDDMRPLYKVNRTGRMSHPLFSSATSSQDVTLKKSTEKRSRRHDANGSCVACHTKHMGSESQAGDDFQNPLSWVCDICHSLHGLESKISEMGEKSRASLHRLHQSSSPVSTGRVFPGIYSWVFFQLSRSGDQESPSLAWKSIDHKKREMNIPEDGKVPSISKTDIADIDYDRFEKAGALSVEVRILIPKGVPESDFSVRLLSSADAQRLCVFWRDVETREQFLFFDKPLIPTRQVLQLKWAVDNEQSFCILCRIVFLPLLESAKCVSLFLHEAPVVALTHTRQGDRS